MSRSRLWLIPLVGALMAPLVTWLPILAMRFPNSGMPRYFRVLPGGHLELPTAASLDIMHMDTFWLILYVAVGLLIALEDQWLGLMCVVLGCELFLFGGVLYGFHHFVFLGGALLLWAVRQMPKRHKPLALKILAASGCFQAVYMIQQWVGYDILWSPIWWGVLVPANETYRLVGTLGTVDAASAYVAITAPLMPLWALPIAIVAVLLGHSIGAAIALGVGLLIAYHRTWRLTAGLASAMLAGAAYVFVAVQQWHIPSTVTTRIDIARLAFADWWHVYPIPNSPIFYEFANPVTGNGSWYPRIVQLQEVFGTAKPEAFAQAHNEYLQWGYAHGALGVGILGAWLYEHRGMFRDSAVGASLVALAIVSGSFFTFQVVSVALLGVCLIGLGTAYSSQEGA